MAELLQKDAAITGTDPSPRHGKTSDATAANAANASDERAMDEFWDDGLEDGLGSPSATAEEEHSLVEPSPHGQPAQDQQLQPAKAAEAVKKKRSILSVFGGGKKKGR